MKKLGQHFLKNVEKVKKIINSLGIEDGETIIEIGPGHGEITKELLVLDSLPTILAIEKDEVLAQGLKNEAEKSGSKNLEILEGDALKILEPLSRKIASYKLVGNIPYYITGYLLRVLGELEKKPEVIVLTIQKEVAERICAKPGAMNLLGASIQFWADPEIIDIIPKKDFEPPPKVDSAIIRLVTKFEKIGSEEVSRYYKLLKILFKQPRKTIFNNLRAGLKEEKEGILRKAGAAGINLDDRPQSLGPEQINNLARILYN